jgi:hypothetical protein
MASHRTTFLNRAPLPHLTAFDRFPKLPLELRLMIWRFALPGPRIVHLSKKSQRVLTVPYWWKHVRSDTPIEGPPLPIPYPDVVAGDDHYTAFEVDKDDINSINYRLAKERLLTRDDMVEGTMTRDDAERIIWRERTMPVPGRNCPDTFYGYFSESETPAVLLACKESRNVASDVYTRAFSLPGFLPHTYFDFHVDTLYLTPLTVPELRCFRMKEQFTNDIKRGVEFSDLARVEHLALEWNGCLVYPTNTDAGILVIWLYALHQLFPNLKSLTIAPEHYTHRLGYPHFISSTIRLAEDCRNLKWVSTSKDPSTNEARINGYLIDPSICQPYPDLYGTHPIYQQEVIDRAARIWEENYPNCQWRFPNIEQKIMMTEATERQLLQEAFNIHKICKKGCWYINPEDPADFEECANGGVETN